MILYELFDGEENPIYRSLEEDNLERQYDFLASVVRASISAQQPMISTALIKALNYHAVACLHAQAGAYRPCDVRVASGADTNLVPPAFHRVPALMDHFINEVNAHWSKANVWDLSTYCLWKLNYIHPFINGNGRTARALCYYVVCVKSGGLIPGSPILPRLMHRDRDEYVQLLHNADQMFAERDPHYLRPLRAFVMRLVLEQLG